MTSQEVKIEDKRITLGGAIHQSGRSLTLTLFCDDVKCKVKKDDTYLGLTTRADPGPGLLGQRDDDII